MPGSPRDRYKPIFVEISTYRHLDVEPGTDVHAGETLTVTGVGPCPPSGEVTLELHDASGKYVAGPPGSYTIDENREWSGPFVVPDTAKPGTYSLRAGCASRSWGVIPYTPLSITVLADGQAAGTA